MKFLKGQIPFFSMFLISLSIMMAQILLLRFSRPAFVLDLQFVIISSAVLGFGLGNLIVYFFFRSKDKELGKFFVVSGSLYAVFSVLPFVVLHLTNFYSLTLVAAIFFVSELSLYVLGGILIGLVFRYYSKPETVYWIYFFNLLGSGLGAFLVIFLLDAVGIYTVVINFILALITALSYAVYYKFLRSACALAIGVILVILFSNQLVSEFKVHCAPQKKLISSLVNSFSQVDLYKSGTDPKSAQLPGSISTAPNYLEIYFECSNTLSLPDYDDLDQVKSYPNNFPYLVKKYDQAVILGSGGGLEVAEAVLSGVKKIVAVEINPLVVKTADIANPNNIFKSENVSLVVKEGRRYMMETGEKFDLVYIPSSKNFGNAGLKSYALQANYLYSKESFGVYLNHLNNEGILAVLDLNPIIPQYLSTIRASLAGSGRNPEDLIVVQGKQRSIILYKDNGFSVEELDNINKQSRLMGSEAIPNPKSSSDLPVITLDRPYLAFHHLDKAGLAPQSRAQALLHDLIYILAALLISYLILLSVMYIKNSYLRKTKSIPLLVTFTGLGFIAVELYIIEKLSVLLGHPTVAIAVGSASFMIFGGIGSLTAGRIRFSRETVLVPLIISLNLLVYYLAMGKIVEFSSSWEFSSQILISLILVGLPGFLMGFFFAKLLAITASSPGTLLPLAIGLDGLATFLGGLMFEALAISLGLSVGLIVGVVAYALCAVVFLFQKKLTYY